MKLASSFLSRGLGDIAEALAGGTLVLYSVARPASPDDAVQRSSVLATFTFGSPAFDPNSSNGNQRPLLAANRVRASATGTPGFARAFNAQGAPVADFSVGPGNTEIKLSEVSTTSNYPIALIDMKLSVPPR